MIGHLGPDLLGPGWDQAEAVRRLREHQDTTIGEALLDQRNLAGIGTIYRAETLFLRGVSPWRPVGGIDDLDGLVSLARRLLEANKHHASTVTTGDRPPWLRDVGLWQGRQTLPPMRISHQARRNGITTAGTPHPVV
ncbi:hypothetical protein [Nonomuraea dietziae]|uniref:hypothetical protein n=1 Tax=Nonomuraea dietziae TaxID=65515 RepID=UPI0031E398EA